MCENVEATGVGSKQRRVSMHACMALATYCCPLVTVKPKPVCFCLSHEISQLPLPGYALASSGPALLPFESLSLGHADGRWALTGASRQGSRSVHQEALAAWVRAEARPKHRGKADRDE